MNRERQIAQVITDLRDYVPTSMTDEMVDYAARQIVATLLPQVTTVDEMEAYAAEAIVMDANGRTWPVDCIIESDFRNGPLTVVWQPEAIS